MRVLPLFALLAACSTPSPAPTPSGLKLGEDFCPASLSAYTRCYVTQAKPDGY